MRHILVVEDNRDNMVLITDVLKSMGYAVIPAKDGEEGVKSARSNRPDLILMDLSLPRVDGWTATRMLKADDQLNMIPVIALTAHAMSGDRQRALDAGCDDYISKPINLRELRDKIQKYLAHLSDSSS